MQKRIMPQIEDNFHHETMVFARMGGGRGGGFHTVPRRISTVDFPTLGSPLRVKLPPLMKAVVLFLQCVCKFYYHVD